VSFEPEHLASLEPRECHLTELTAHNQVTTPNYPLHTFLLEDKPIAVFGGIFIHLKYAQAWACISDDVKKAPIEFARKASRLVYAYEKNFGLERLEISVRADYHIGQRFARMLGFEREGILRRYGRDGADYHLYSRVKWPTQPQQP
jgi:hypothetical protein